jgi:flagella basal body P-ring formation protein FlgA
LEDKLVIKRALLLGAIWFSLSVESKASQEQISGSDLAYLVIEILNKEGLSSQPVIKRDRIFVGCNNKNVVIKKRYESWKTVELTCQTNKSWRYTFRNKLANPIGLVKTHMPHEFLKESATKDSSTVFVLKHSKKKGDKLEESDLVLSEEKKLLSNGAFNDLKEILGKRLKRSLRKGAILKANHLNPDWLVYKNQKVIIEHNIGEIYVKMNGIALSNGARGERILVKNISSNKTVEGFVKSEKRISIFSKIN